MLRRLSIALLGVAALALVYGLTELLERGVDVLVARIGAVPTLVLVGAVTVALSVAWLRYGGARVLRRWGLVLKPARSAAPAEEGARTEPGHQGPRRLARPRR